MRAERPLFSIAAAVLALGAVLPVAAARTPIAAQAPESSFASEVRAELKRRDASWYDPEQDAWRKVDPPWWSSFEGRGGGLGGSISLPSVLVVAAVVGAAVLLVVVVARTWQPRAPSRRHAKGESRTEAVLSHLPLPIAGADEDFTRALAAALAARDWRRALILSYAHQLARTADLSWIQLHPSKSNRRYQRELRRAPDVTSEIVTLFDRSVADFEAVYFGAHDQSERELEASLERYRKFMALLDHRAEVAA